MKAIIKKMNLTDYIVFGGLLILILIFVLVPRTNGKNEFKQLDEYKELRKDINVVYNKMECDGYDQRGLCKSMTGHLHYLNQEIKIMEEK